MAVRVNREGGCDGHIEGVKGYDVNDGGMGG